MSCNQGVVNVIRSAGDNINRSRSAHRRRNVIGNGNGLCNHCCIIALVSYSEGTGNNPWALTCWSQILVSNRLNSAVGGSCNAFGRKLLDSNGLQRCAVSQG